MDSVWYERIGALGQKLEESDAKSFALDMAFIDFSQWFQSENSSGIDFSQFNQPTTQDTVNGLLRQADDIAFLAALVSIKD